MSAPAPTLAECIEALHALVDRVTARVGEDPQAAAAAVVRRIEASAPAERAELLIAAVALATEARLRSQGTYR